MNHFKRISKVFKEAYEISFDNESRIVLMSDCHRGTGDWSDTFLKNQNIYFSALMNYYENGYTYIELGDGDELWENKRMNDILEIHNNVFWILNELYCSGRFHMIYGNHDMIKKEQKFIKKCLCKCLNREGVRYEPLFKDFCVHEGIILKYNNSEKKIFLLHGHQGDLLNDSLWKLSRFLVRYLWKPLENFGVKDPTRAAKSYKEKNKVDKRLSEWAVRENVIVIAGHTHRPMFPDVGEVPYFNDGSCVHPRCITAIEILDGYILLVKWSIKTDKDGMLYIGRDILEGPTDINEYFNSMIRN
ncbi:metallophosphoesterase [Clostridium sp. D43t1_170807_H7]|uniref:metallophosphoesterase n=1 Tax=Clostridium sp. D43t1_170807_H7 TaxID=2787140 RepID=UPI00189BA355|nr:metallophosphoesterase [Clostridium sp. D43t1_170807_H7]